MRALRQQSGQGVAAKHLQGAIAVADAGADQPADDLVVTPGKEPSPPRVLPVDPPANRDGSGVKQVNQAFEVGEIELAVGVGEGYVVAAGGFEPGSQGRPVAAVGLMPQQLRT